MTVQLIATMITTVTANNDDGDDELVAMVTIAMMTIVAMMTMIMTMAT